MNDVNLYCKSREGFKIKVGRLTRDEETGDYMFIKNRPHFMRIVGGYGIQREVFDEKGREHNLAEIFRKRPDIKVKITDLEREAIYVSTAKDWTTHFHKGNYGDGTQMFLSVNYMKPIHV